MSSIAIIGAGLAGLACARALRERTFDVTLFEKARGPGFRLRQDGLALCGDGWAGGRVEDAWRSGHHLGRALAELRLPLR